MWIQLACIQPEGLPADQSSWLSNQVPEYQNYFVLIEGDDGNPIGIGDTAKVYSPDTMIQMIRSGELGGCFGIHRNNQAVIDRLRKIPSQVFTEKDGADRHTKLIFIDVDQ